MEPTRKKLEDEGWWQRDLGLEVQPQLSNGICGLRRFSYIFNVFVISVQKSHSRGSVVVVVLLLLIPDAVMIDPSAEARQWLIWASVTGLGVACARSGAWLSLLGVVLLALTNTQALDPGGCGYITIMVALISQACFRHGCMFGTLFVGAGRMVGSRLHPRGGHFCQQDAVYGTSLCWNVSALVV